MWRLSTPTKPSALHTPSRPRKGRPSGKRTPARREEGPILQRVTAVRGLCARSGLGVRPDEAALLPRCCPATGVAVLMGALVVLLGQCWHAWRGAQVSNS